MPIGRYRARETCTGRVVGTCFGMESEYRDSCSSFVNDQRSKFNICVLGGEDLERTQSCCNSRGYILKCITRNRWRGLFKTFERSPDEVRRQLDVRSFIAGNEDLRHLLQIFEVNNRDN